ncbi:Rubrerythrin [Candidatus Epulonipiscioides gigas]|nr:Rubrerythrin [Epulopiscium sp. SCG-C07WGA-EpuloA2]
MQLIEKERQALTNLKEQEMLSIDKYQRYAQQAHDPQLQGLFNNIIEHEQHHLNSIKQVLDGGDIPQVDCNDTQGRDYNPTATYTQEEMTQNKIDDSYLATDSIASEKLISGEYNDDVFVFGNTDVRRLFADIQVEEQNHAEMLYKYKVTNGMVGELMDGMMH